MNHKVIIANRTKTEKPRVIQLARPRHRAALRAWKARQSQERMAFGAGYEDNGLVT